MPSLTQVRTGLITTITTAVPELIGYATVPEVTQVPAVIVRPEKVDYMIGMGACQQWTYAVYVLVARTSSTVNQDQLDAYISATGAKSVVAALRATPGLGLSGVDATVESMEKYGGEWETARIPHIGAQLNVGVLITE